MTKILVVDNEYKMCKLVKTALEMESYSVDMAFSGCEYIKKTDYQIIVTDLTMSNIDGLQVVEYTKQN